MIEDRVSEVDFMTMEESLDGTSCITFVVQLDVPAIVGTPVIMLTLEFRDWCPVAQFPWGKCIRNIISIVSPYFLTHSSNISEKFH